MAHPIVDILVSGGISGAAYAMMAVGFTLVYGVSRLWNLAYGSFYTMSGYFAWLFLTRAELGYPATFAIVLPALFFIGMGTERLTIRPTRATKDWEMPAVISCVGLFLFLDNIYLAIFGPFKKSFPPLFKGAVHVADITVAAQDVAIVVIAISTMVGLWFFLNRTKPGLAMQATSQDMDGASIVGIDGDRVFSQTYGIACVLVGLAAILLTPKLFVSPLGGWGILLKAWIITVLGGMGSLTGAIYAAFIVGMVEAFVGWQLGLTWTFLVLFAIMIGVFIVRPQGLRGA